MTARRAGVAALGAACVALGGCASFGAIVRERGPEAALCHVGSADDARLVVPALLESAGLAYRVRIMTRADVPDLDAETARDLFDGYVVALVEVQLGDEIDDGRWRPGGGEIFTHPKPSGIASARFLRFAGQQRIPLTQPETLVAITGEPPPRYKTVNGTSYDAGQIGRAFLTLGASLLFESPHPTQTQQLDPSYDFARDAPRAAKLKKALDAALPNVDMVVVPRAGWPKDARVEAELEVATSEDESCSGAVRATVTSPPVPLAPDASAAFHPFVVTTWKQARVETDRRHWIFRSQENVEVPSPAPR